MIKFICPECGSQDEPNELFISKKTKRLLAKYMMKDKSNLEIK